MKIFAVVDDNQGMLFNNRRQSQDRCLREQILLDCAGKRLWMNEYSARQFDTPLPDNLIVDEEYLDKAGADEACFVENLSLSGYEAQISRLTLFRWNRVYPADTYFTIDLTNGEWKRTFVEEFEGNSHEKITKEVWEHECGQE